MEYVQVRINEDGTLRNQRFAFSDRFTLITELLQNGRRAGATLIEISHDPVSQTLRVIDDGHGIEDFSKLLTFNESGWDEALQAEEHPFGAGFSRCLYASTRGIVTSRGKRIDVANVERKMPQDLISTDGFHITDRCRAYLSPLIAGEDYPPYRHGLPDYVRQKNVAVPRRLGEFQV